MEIRPVAADFFHEDGQIDRQTWRSYNSLNAIFAEVNKKRPISVVF
jgi:hypothetical protein